MTRAATAMGAGVKATVEEIVDRVIRPAAEAVDREARFPQEAMGALREQRLLSAGIPRELGGLGMGLSELSEVAQRLARGCGASSMVWGMHQIQLACLLAAADSAPYLAESLRSIAERQSLLASVTSEVGIGGDLRSSAAAVVELPHGLARLEKQAPTISYGAEAEAYLVTARRSPESPADDQVAVLLWRDQVELESTGGWDAMGMRGTSSPGFRLQAEFAREQILPVSFGKIAAQAMVPWSHILWSSTWYGLALEAFDRARRVARGRAVGGQAPADLRLAEVGRWLSLLRASISEAIAKLVPSRDSLGLVETARLNDLKLSASRLSLQAALVSLEVAGMAGYQERATNSVARIVRDLLSAPLMIANERILQTNARFALARGA